MSAVAVATEITVPVRPTAEQIDELAKRYNDADAVCAVTDKAFKAIEKEAIDLVTAWGVVPPKAESSRRIEGKLAKLTVTTGSSIAIDESRVEDLRQALVANERSEFFAKLFQPRIKHELVEGADVALKTEPLNKRLAEKVLALFGRCFKAKKKAPSLKVELLIPTPKAKKPRKPKVGE
jgi:hypothetical protein